MMMIEEEKHMKKLMVFPLNDDVNILVRNIALSNEYEVVAVCSFQEDLKKLSMLQLETSILCSTDFKLCMHNADIVLFADDIEDRSKTAYTERVKIALEEEKDIYVSSKFHNWIGNMEIYQNVHIIEEMNGICQHKSEKLKEIPIPVVSVMGMGENCSKFELQIKMKHYIETFGYKVLSICSNPLGQFLNMCILPPFLFSYNYSLKRKIEAFNEWIYELIDKEKYDLILLGYPGGILPLNELENNFYSEIALVLSNAVISDIGILSVYSSFDQREESMKTLSSLCLKKFNTYVEDFIIGSKYYKTEYEAKKSNITKLIKNETIKILMIFITFLLLRIIPKYKL